MNQFDTSKILLLTICLLQLGIIQSSAQEPEEKESYNRLSGALYGSYIFGEKARGLQIFSSRFNVVSEPTYAVGGDLRYAITPLWSLEGGYRYSTLEGEGFKTTIHTASVKNTFNLNRVYRRHSLSEVLNPYIILGVEQDFFSAEGPDDEFSRSEASLIGGLGLSVRLSNRIELFGQHEIKLSSNRLDLNDGGYPYDQIGMASGGIRIHFGSSDKKPLNLAPPTLSITEDEYENLTGQLGKAEATEQRVTDLSEKVDSLENRINEMEQKYQNTIDEHTNRISTLEEQTDSLVQLSHCPCDGQSQGDEQSQTDRELRSTVEAGHYVQVFASVDYEYAERVKNEFIDNLEGTIDNPEEMVFVIQRQRYYEVLIGTFSQFSEAQRVLDSATAISSDAFIISFARPVHLKEVYEGTRIMQP